MHVLIAAGPTREPIDAVRFVSNRSSGRLGSALADAATDAGHEVTLLLGPAPVHAALADRCSVHRFETCADLERLLDEHFRGCDVLIMAAAVADYRPMEAPDHQKMPRGESLTLRLEPTPDLVARVAAGKRDDQKVIAFALEQADQLESRAVEKMRRKGVDAIVANPLGTMEASQITAVWFTASGLRLEPGPMPKPLFARWLIDRAAELLA